MINLSRLSKEEILQLFNQRCKHGHRLISHPNCIGVDSVLSERIGYLDIETYGLDADWGQVLSYCIIDDKNNIYGRTVRDFNEVSKCVDKLLVQDCITDMLKFDRLVVHYGGAGRFDVPYLRTRALANGLKFPEHGTLALDDTWPIAKYKLKLSSNSQSSVHELITGASQKTHIDKRTWRKAFFGDKPSLKYIWEHNLNDCKELRDNYKALCGFQKKTNRSL